MKRSCANIGMLLAFAICASAQSPTTRTVALVWGASSSNVTGYVVQTSTASATGPFAPIGCTGTVTIATGYTGPACVSGSTASTLAYLDIETIGTTAYYQIVAVAPACTGSTPIGTPCGNSLPSVTITAPVPPRPTAVTTIVSTISN